MPVPKSKQKLYGKVVGHMQNVGYGYEEAKDIADRAVKSKPKGKSKGKAKAPTKGR
jgi:hypothetical protein